MSTNRYCVRPNSGRIEPSRDVEVQVLLQAMKEDPPPDARCRDKFLVQSVAVKSDTSDANVSQVWASIEREAKSSIQEKKIRVSFLPADSNTTSTGASSGAAGGGTPATTNGVMAAAGVGGAAGAAGAAGLAASSAGRSEEPPAYTSPSIPASTPQKAGTTESRDTYSSPAAGDSSLPPQSAATAATSTAAIGTIPKSQDDLQAQLAEAKATIARLQEQAAEGLRQRKPQETAQKAVESVQQSMQNAPAPGGVPIQITAGLCLLCFLLAWLFF